MVDPVAEGQVGRLVAVEVEPVGLPERRGVPVGRGEGDRDQFALRDGHAPDGDVLPGHPLRGEVERAVVPEELLDGVLDHAGVLQQLGALVGMGQQRQGGVADEVDRGLVPGQEEQEAGRDELDVVELVLLVAGLHQPGQDVVGRVPALLVHERHEPLDHPRDAPVPLLGVVAGAERPRHHLFDERPQPVPIGCRAPRGARR